MTSHTGSKILAFAVMENPAARFSTRRQETTKDEGVKPSTHPTVNLQATHAGGYAPDMTETDVGKLAAPDSHGAAAEAQRQQFVPTTLPALEAGIGQCPHAVDTVDPIRFSNDVIKEYLQNMTS